MANNVRHLSILVASTLLGMGCATPSAGPSPTDVSELRKQIFELQKVQGVQAGQIEELNNKVLLLNDKIGLHSSSTQTPSGAITTPPINGPAPGSPVQKTVPPVLPTSPSKTPSGEAGLRGPNPSLPPLSNTVVAVAPPAIFKEKSGASVVTGAERIYSQALFDAKKPQTIALEKDVQTLLASYKESPVTNNALFLLADTYYSRKQYFKAAEQFERLYKLFPDGNKAVGSLYRLGLCYQKMGHPSEAKEAFENVVTIYPGSREALQAEKLLQNDTEAVQ